MTLKLGGFFVTIYQKKPLSVTEQAPRLLERGLVCDEPERLKKYLNDIGYYRLSAYSLPFEQPASPGSASRNHQFQPGTSFDQILGLYIFDRKLRLLMMDAFERIEVAIRGRWSNALALGSQDSHAHMCSAHFMSGMQHALDITQMANLMEKNSEDFVKH